MKPEIAYDDFDKLDIRIGKVTEATPLENSKKLIKLTVTFGGEIGVRTILAGMAEWYGPEDFMGKKFPFLVNLAPKKMAGSESQGMMMAADIKGTPKLIHADDSIPEGSIIR